MKKHSLIIKAMALLMLVTMTLPFAVGCGIFKKAEEKTVLENVFKGESFKLPEEIQWIESVTYSNERILFICHVSEEVERIGEVYKDDGAQVKPVDAVPETAAPDVRVATTMVNTYNYDVPEETKPVDVDGDGQFDEGYYSYVDTVTKQKIYTVKIDGSEGKFIEIPSEGDNRYVNSYLVANDGIWYNVNEWKYDEETGDSKNNSYMSKIDFDGNKVTEIKVNDLFGNAEEFYGVNRVISDASGNLYLSANSDILILDNEGKKLRSIQTDDYFINNVAVSGEGEVFAFCYKEPEYKTVIKKIDVAAGVLGDDVAMNSQIANYSYNLMTGPGYSFYYNDSNSIYGYDAKTDTVSEVLNWINSDYNSNEINQIAIIDKDNVIAVKGNNYGGRYYRSMSYMAGDSSAEAENALVALILKRVDAQTLADKKILTLATSYTDYKVRSIIIDFNKKNDKYRIQINDYSKYNNDNDWQLGIKMLNNDIVAGKIPDLICLDEQMPFESYASKGIFADLYEFIDKDDEIKREDYLANIFEAYSINGKLYRLVPSFYVNTVSGKTKFVGDGTSWTFDDLQKLLDSCPEGTTAFADITQEDFLRQVLYMSSGEYIDKDTGKCSFDTPEFVKLLEFAKKLDTKSIWEDFDYENADEKFWQERETACFDDRVLLENTYLSGFSDYWRTYKATFGEDITMVGYPTKSGKNGSAIYGSLTLAIAQNSKNKDGAWEFVRSFMLDDYQKTITYGWPIKLSRIDELAKRAMTPPKERENDDMMYYGNSTKMWIGGKEVEIGVIDQEHVDIVRKFISSITNVASYNQDMINIILEEADAYFNGQKSAETVVKIIQDRVQKMVSENR